MGRVVLTVVSVIAEVFVARMRIERRLAADAPLR
jgi:hypothetical protein